MVFCQAQDSTFLHDQDYKIFYYPNGVKSSEGRIVDGKPDGWWKSYNEKGILVSEGNRKNFLLDSLWTFYNDDASLRMTVHYKADMKDGEQIVYQKDEYTVTHWRQDTIVCSVDTYDTNKVRRKTVPYMNAESAAAARSSTAPTSSDSSRAAGNIFGTMAIFGLKRNISTTKSTVFSSIMMKTVIFCMWRSMRTTSW